MAERQQARRKARPVKRPAKPAVDLKRENAALKRNLRERTAELALREEQLREALEENTGLRADQREALERQTATAEVLQVINRSPGDLAPVFEAILEKAHHLCAVTQGSLQLYDGERLRAVATHGLSQAFAERLRQGYIPGSRLPVQRLLRGARFAQADLAEIDDPMAHAAAELSGLRTTLFVPLRKEGTFLGQIVAARHEVKPFTEKEIALLENFAAQAVIAMENARLLTETGEALEQQTATAEVLQVINSSPGELAPVFDTMLEKGVRLSDAGFGILLTLHGETFLPAAMRGVPAPYAEFLSRHPLSFAPSSGPARVLAGQRFHTVADFAADPLTLSGDPQRRALVELGGARTGLAVPLRKDAALLGIFVVFRPEVRPFTEKQIALLENFAAQAVIAIENARLITETREALEQQTATAEVLQVINESPGDLAPVFDAILEKAHSLCAIAHGNLHLYDGEKFHAVAVRGLPEEFANLLRRGFTPGPNHPSQRLLEGERCAHISDVAEIDDPMQRAAVELGGVRTVLFVPLRKDETLLGQIVAARREVRPFTEKEIALLESFAAQAVIAIENARLLDELRQRTADLARSVDELTATGNVLKIISRSSVDLETVLDTLVETVARLCRAEHAAMFRQRGDANHLVASYGISEEAKEFTRAHPLPPDRRTLSGRVTLERRAVHIPDVLQDQEYAYEGQKIIGYRSILGVPLLREDTLIGTFSMHRTHVDPFTDKEIELVTSFADQAVIAIENARLFDELRERQAELRVTFDNMGDGVAMFDGQQRLAAWNSNFQQILDLPDAFLAERPSYVEYFRYLAQRGEYSTDLEAELSRTIEDTSRELRVERSRPDGRVIEVRRNAVPGGGFVLIYADITERKRSEEAIRAARDAAEAALRELQAAQASLVHAQKLAALGQLTAGIAHEIKNPLNFVNNFAGLSVELLDELKEASAQAIGALDAEQARRDR
jgi:PAS domain S-box-containing protein